MEPTKVMGSLKKQVPNLEDRKKMCTQFLAKKGLDMQEPIPIRIEPAKQNNHMPIFKTIVFDNQEAGVLYAFLRRELRLNKTEGLYLFGQSKLITYSTDMLSLYKQKKDADGFLYINYRDTAPF